MEDALKAAAATCMELFGVRRGLVWYGTGVD